MASKRTVLLVDDDPAVVATVSEPLRQFGYNVVSAQNATQALRISAEFASSIDLLISDIHLPEMKGTDLAVKIQEERPKIKVVYISGDPEAKRMILVGSGKTSFLQKPFTMRELEDTMIGILGTVPNTTFKKAMRCPTCDSENMRRSHTRLHEIVLLPVAVPYRCRECRRRFFRVRLSRTLLGGS